MKDPLTSEPSPELTENLQFSLDPLRVEETILEEEYKVFEPTKTVVCCLTHLDLTAFIGVYLCPVIEHFNEEHARQTAKHNALMQLISHECSLFRAALDRATPTGSKSPGQIAPSDDDEG